MNEPKLCKPERQLVRNLGQGGHYFGGRFSDKGVTNHILSRLQRF